MRTALSRRTTGTSRIPDTRTRHNENTTQRKNQDGGGGMCKTPETENEQRHGTLRSNKTAAIVLWKSRKMMGEASNPYVIITFAPARTWTASKRGHGSHRNVLLRWQLGVTRARRASRAAQRTSRVRQVPLSTLKNRDELEKLEVEKSPRSRNINERWRRTSPPIINQSFERICGQCITSPLLPSIDCT